MPRKAKPAAEDGRVPDTYQPESFTPFSVPDEIGPWGCPIIGHGWEDADQLLAHPENFRIHPRAQQDALEGSLNAVGWFDEVTVNVTTGHVIDGHLRDELSITHGSKVPVRYVRMSEDNERLVLASKDAISAAAVTDGDKLNELLGQLTINNEGLDNLFASLLSDAQKTTMQDVAGDGTDAEKESTQRDIGDKKTQIKPVLYADEIAVFESALRQTGEKNRGHALIQVCKFYLENGQANPVRQCDDTLESLLAH